MLRDFQIPTKPAPATAATTIKANEATPERETDTPANAPPFKGVVEGAGAGVEPDDDVPLELGLLKASETLPVDDWVTPNDEDVAVGRIVWVTPLTTEGDTVDTIVDEPEVDVVTRAPIANVSLTVKTLEIFPTFTNSIW